MEKTTKNIAIFASGTGTNARAIIQFFKKNPESAKVVLIVSNNPLAGVLLIADVEKIPVFIIPKEDLEIGKNTLAVLQQNHIDFIVLAGYLKKIPEILVNHFEGKMVNIHPALLPKFGGKGMYGDRVHESVIKSGDKESGITIHHVNSKYDEGDIIFQAKCSISENETPQSLSLKVRELEHLYYPTEIYRIIQSLPII
jgi:phosphoribosylglycinamide formyltransferase-1